MKYIFHKYHGTGNDFIMLDGRIHPFPLQDHQAITGLCHRRFGIGADGLIVLTPDEKYAFYMHYFNANGLPGSMCGNGARCAVLFAQRSGFFHNDTVVFNAYDGVHHANLMNEQSSNLVELQMANVEKVEMLNNDFFIDTGSPHHIVLCQDVQTKDVITHGRAIRNNPYYKNAGVNVNFVQYLDKTLHVRTYERGVEDETLSCGTGVTASAIAWAFHTNMHGDVSLPIATLGGSLEVKFNHHHQTFTDVKLVGPATYVFSGEITI